MLHIIKILQKRFLLVGAFKIQPYRFKKLSMPICDDSGQKGQIK